MFEALGKLCRRSDDESIVQALATEAPTWLVQFPALVKRGPGSDGAVGSLSILPGWTVSDRYGLYRQSSMDGSQRKTG
jgi:hypothetical protein